MISADAVRSEINRSEEFLVLEEGNEVGSSDIVGFARLPHRIHPAAEGMLIEALDVSEGVHEKNIPKELIGGNR